MKSGTNWACNLLNLHPDVSCFGEYHWESLLGPFEKSLVRRSNLRRKDTLRRMRRRLERTIKETMLDLADETARCIGDRTPGPIEPFFVSDAKYITMIRDGRDVLVSRAFHLLARPERADMFRDDPLMAQLLARFQSDPRCFEAAPGDLLSSRKFVERSAEMWKNILAADTETRQRFPELPVLRVRYEELHADVEAGRRRMYQFLGLDPDQASGLDARTKAGFETTDPTSLYRSGQVGDWKRYWTEHVETWFMEIAAETLQAQGYA